MGSSCTRSQNRGLMGQPALNCRRWNSWKSWQRSCPCRASTSCAMPAVWRRTASCERRLSRRRASRGGRGGGKDGNTFLELGQAPGARVCFGYGHVSSATVWAEGSAQTRCADTVAPGLATFLPPLCGRREPCDLPFCRRSSLRIIAAIPQESVITRILRHLKLASVPPPIAPVRCRQELFAFR